MPCQGSNSADLPLAGVVRVPVFADMLVLARICRGGGYRVFVWTVEDHLRGKSDAIRTLFEAFENLVGDCGSYERSVTKTAIAYKGSVRGFA